MKLERSLEQIATDAQETLKKSGLAGYYLRDRFISGDLVEKFKIGYCLRSIEFPNLENRVTFPIYDCYHHQMVAIGARALARDLLPKYWLTPGNWKSSSLYNLDRSKKSIFGLNFAIVVEGFVDVIRLYQYKITNTVALIGTSFTFHQACLLARYTDRVVFVLDGDQGGRSGLARAHQEAARAGLQSYSCWMPDGLDPDEFLLQRGAEKFAELVKRALSGKSLLDSINRRIERLIEI